MTDLQLGRHFTLSEFLQSQTASRMGKALTLDPEGETSRNLRRLVEQVLDPLRDAAGAPIHVTSGYRPAWLNKQIGGSAASAHLTGHAADIVIPGRAPLWVCQKVLALHLPFDQLILEFGRWTHVGISRTGGKPRRQVLTAGLENGKTRYHAGLHA